MNRYIILKKAVESTTSAYCTDLQRLFYNFSTHRMGDTASQKNHKKVFANQHTRHSRYDSTAFFRIITLLLFMTNTVFALDETSSYWECTTSDVTDKTWTSKSPYKKVAMNVAFEFCKKESNAPESCKKNAEKCLGVNQIQIQGVDLKWQCTALDFAADAWKSEFFARKEDAALSAKSFCKHKSHVPETCYINLVTCATNRDSI